jgi:hypothetical protein
MKKRVCADRRSTFRLRTRLRTRVRRRVYTHTHTHTLLYIYIHTHTHVCLRTRVTLVLHVSTTSFFKKNRKKTSYRGLLQKKHVCLRRDVEHQCPPLFFSISGHCKFVFLYYIRPRFLFFCLTKISL